MWDCLLTASESILEGLFKAKELETAETHQLASVDSNDLLIPGNL